jgi:hypothetical protein
MSAICPFKKRCCEKDASGFCHEDLKETIPGEDGNVIAVCPKQ